MLINLKVKKDKLLRYALTLLLKTFKKRFFAENFNDIEIIINSLPFVNKLEYLIWKHKILPAKKDRQELLHHLSNLDKLIISHWDTRTVLRALLYYDDLVVYLCYSKTISLTVREFISTSTILHFQILKFLKSLLMEFINETPNLNLFFEMAEYLEGECILNKDVSSIKDIKENTESLFRIVYKVKRYYTQVKTIRHFKPLLKTHLSKKLDLIMLNLALYHKLAAFGENHQFLIQSLNEYTLQLKRTKI